ncbi:hypothetical protein GCM10010187_46790 [Actinomadura coerulea]|nr:hypothetical protein GCM10010187_46790 [Actinomadura coerulea]
MPRGNISRLRGVPVGADPAFRWCMPEPNGSGAALNERVPRAGLRYPARADTAASLLAGRVREAAAMAAAITAMIRKASP